jgi:hypothetical protein
LKDALAIVITGQKRVFVPDVPVIRVLLLLSDKKMWMTGTNPVMTERG